MLDYVGHALHVECLRSHQLHLLRRILLHHFFRRWSPLPQVMPQLHSLSKNVSQVETTRPGATDQGEHRPAHCLLRRLQLPHPDANLRGA